MSLVQLQIFNLRNIETAKWDFHPHINLFFGDNGSGKTTVLEAIFMLATGRSFRGRDIFPLLRKGRDQLSLFTRLEDGQSISILKCLNNLTQARLNSFLCHSNSQLAHLLPCLVFYQDLFQIMDAGPAVRRAMLDWGVFYQQPHYHGLWKDYNRALKQRNRLLKEKAPSTHFVPWNKILNELAVQLDHERRNYVLALEREFRLLLLQLTDVSATLTYYKGWDKSELGKPLYSILEENYLSDIRRQFTQYGPHQADLLFMCAQFKTKQFLSRGQQKMVLFALKFAQARLMTRPCFYLCDDISSELDQAHLLRLLQLIMNTKGQFFVTSIGQSNLILKQLTPAKVFYLE